MRIFLFLLFDIALTAFALRQLLIPLGLPRRAETRFDRRWELFWACFIVLIPVFGPMLFLCLNSFPPIQPKHMRCQASIYGQSSMGLGGDGASGIPRLHQLIEGTGELKLAPHVLKVCHREARAGNHEAQAFLGGLYLRGDGVPQDYRTAYLWLLIAGKDARHDRYVAHLSKEARQKLSDADAAAAEQEAAVWKKDKAWRFT
jgi:hypothetical protein